MELVITMCWIGKEGGEEGKRGRDWTRGGKRQKEDKEDTNSQYLPGSVGMLEGTSATRVLTQGEERYWRDEVLDNT